MMLFRRPTPQLLAVDLWMPLHALAGRISLAREFIGSSSNCNLEPSESI